MKIKNSLALLFGLLFVLSTNNIFSMDMKGKHHSNSKYVCPMHPEVKSTKKGNCNICGMSLVKEKEHKHMMYTCPMHPDVKKHEKGRCPICNMDLVPEK